ncbi:flavin monoamine oxidase family protein [Chitinophaga arvensicola]|uniref:Monoamine oxidase n=1 Tax=Chitinophaga arvensicola TaxID=29529 RepID=A0A1I0RUY8_9BACT|nr:NAD(P)/FAD-dependent oxidoreductase [Chitinophaga arvensicola]SEW45193.1 monoamine oxidase [Chitinophaga arvensicola]
MGKTNRITIIGAGLSGLTLAYLLHKAGTKVNILEASPRIGGRIQTQTGQRGTPMELGATWFSDQPPHLIALTEELGLTRFPQFAEGISLFQTKSFEPPQQFYIPASDAPSYRLAGGTKVLIDALLARIGEHAVSLNSRVTAIHAAPDGLVVSMGADRSITADAVVTCIPPQLLVAGITFHPQLPAAVTDVLPAVQTWMAGAVKFTIEFTAPFWRSKKMSGMLYSHAGMVTEMYDHSSYDGDKYALTGFLNPGAAHYSQEVRQEFVLRQLQELFGDEIMQAVGYYDKVWNDEYLLSGTAFIQRPHQYNGHPVFHQPYMNNRLFFCGTETSAVCGGYMEGAVSAAKRTVEALHYAGFA